MSGNSLSGSIPDEIASVNFNAGGGSSGYCTFTSGASPTNAFTCPLPAGLDAKCTAECVSLPPSPPLSPPSVSGVNAEALYSLYEATGGALWTDKNGAPFNAGWPGSAAAASNPQNGPCYDISGCGGATWGHWSGVMCCYGHVRYLCASPPPPLPRGASAAAPIPASPDAHPPRRTGLSTTRTSSARSRPPSSTSSR